MATALTIEHPPEVDYPTGDGQPVGETPIHRDNLLGLVDDLRRFHAGDPMAYVSGNMFLYYEQGNKRKHVSPDVFVAKGIPDGDRDAYFTWIEGKGPDFIIELTSPSTCDEDFDDKFRLYRDVLKVPEYFLFDPKGEYLVPPLRGYRLDAAGEYVRIEPIDGRLPSEVTGLHLEAVGKWLRLWNPATRAWVPTRFEVADAAEAKADAAELKADAAVATADAAEAKADAAKAKADAAVATADAAKARADAAEVNLKRVETELARTEARRLFAEKEHLRTAERLRMAEEEIEQLRRELEGLRRSTT